MAEQTDNIQSRGAQWEAAMGRLDMAEAVYAEYKAAVDPLMDLQDVHEARNGLIPPGAGRNGTPGYFEKRKELFDQSPEYKVPDCIRDRLEKMVDAICEIQTELMQIPAPDLAALRWKLNHTGNAAWSDHYVAQMQIDIDTLMVA